MFKNTVTRGIYRGVHQFRCRHCGILYAERKGLCICRTNSKRSEGAESDSARDAVAHEHAEHGTDPGDLATPRAQRQEFVGSLLDFVHAEAKALFARVEPPSAGPPQSASRAQTGSESAAVYTVRP